MLQILFLLTTSQLLNLNCAKPIHKANTHTIFCHNTTLKDGTHVRSKSAQKSINPSDHGTVANNER